MIRPTSQADISTQLYRDVIVGLSNPRRNLPCKYLYDQRGSELFDLITRLPEYYPTRTETSILESESDAIARFVGRNAALIELGSGSSEKTRLLLDCCADLNVYVPLDISGEYLEQVAVDLQREFPTLCVQPIIADFTSDLKHNWDELLPLHESRIAFFPGSTIGNFVPLEAERLMRRIHSWIGAGGKLIIGVDLQKDHDVLHDAYDDPRGVTAAFNLNLLTRINSELGANFNEDQFEHVANYNVHANRVEMFLVSLEDQEVAIGQHRFKFSKGERICTEYSHKYTVDGFQELAKRCGFAVRHCWTDAREFFAVFALVAVS